uniref:Uncharacterized protein n=1 Tax=Chromera velia CCMP2878 TaxID=1169474 RepID=A0A0G4HAE3_9ALVE|eukprot:Cvel_25698.t1-p1 / transcript=Cvel_25698.t1 / gene=Cvel_25698 / organism=Chromera_velia_CCMP2878 / gene_product=hypothetical protein / transcript_product=hypothetical protein / location=Cvel_scaffold2948:9865-16124(-) / protein_length=1215 / sequence_SO=supercontig / SO=protein_coding / is_pseudo=false
MILDSSSDEEARPVSRSPVDVRRLPGGGRGEVKKPTPKSSPESLKRGARGSNASFSPGGGYKDPSSPPEKVSVPEANTSPKQVEVEGQEKVEQVGGNEGEHTETKQEKEMEEEEDEELLLNRYETPQASPCVSPSITDTSAPSMSPSLPAVSPATAGVFPEEEKEVEIPEIRPADFGELGDVLNMIRDWPAGGLEALFSSDPFKEFVKDNTPYVLSILLDACAMGRVRVLSALRDTMKLNLWQRAKVEWEFQGENYVVDHLAGALLLEAAVKGPHIPIWKYMLALYLQKKMGNLPRYFDLQQSTFEKVFLGGAEKLDDLTDELPECFHIVVDQPKLFGPDSHKKWAAKPELRLAFPTPKPPKEEKLAAPEASPWGFMRDREARKAAKERARRSAASSRPTPTPPRQSASGGLFPSDRNFFDLRRVTGTHIYLKGYCLKFLRAEFGLDPTVVSSYDMPYRMKSTMPQHLYGQAQESNFDEMRDYIAENREIRRDKEFRHSGPNSPWWANTMAVMLGFVRGRDPESAERMLTSVDVSVQAHWDIRSFGGEYFDHQPITIAEILLREAVAVSKSPPMLEALGKAITSDWRKEDYGRRATEACAEKAFRMAAYEAMSLGDLDCLEVLWENRWINKPRMIYELLSRAVAPRMIAWLEKRLDDLEPVYPPSHSSCRTPPPRRRSRSPPRRRSRSRSPEPSSSSAPPLQMPNFEEMGTQFPPEQVDKLRKMWAKLAEDEERKRARRAARERERRRERRSSSESSNERRGRYREEYHDRGSNQGGNRRDGPRGSRDVYRGEERPRAGRNVSRGDTGPFGGRPSPSRFQVRGGGGGSRWPDHPPLKSTHVPAEYYLHGGERPPMHRPPPESADRFLDNSRGPPPPPPPGFSPVREDELGRRLPPPLDFSQQSPEGTSASSNRGSHGSSRGFGNNFIPTPSPLQEGGPPMSGSFSGPPPPTEHSAAAAAEYGPPFPAATEYGPPFAAAAAAEYGPPFPPRLEDSDCPDCQGKMVMKCEQECQPEACRFCHQALVLRCEQDCRASKAALSEPVNIKFLCDLTVYMGHTPFDLSKRTIAKRIDAMRRIAEMGELDDLKYLLDPRGKIALSLQPTDAEVESGVDRQVLRKAVLEGAAAGGKQSMIEWALQAVDLHSPWAADGEGGETIGEHLADVCASRDNYETLILLKLRGVDVASVLGKLGDSLRPRVAFWYGKGCEIPDYYKRRK